MNGGVRVLLVNLQLSDSPHNPRQRSRDLLDYLDDSPLVVEYVYNKLFRRQMLNRLLAARVLDVEVHGQQIAIVVVLQNIFNHDLPSVVVLVPSLLIEPLDAVGELVELHGLGLRVILTALRERDLVVPDVPRLAAPGSPVEEK